MSKRTDVLFAIKQMIQVALPGAKVIGLDGKEAPPQRVPATGMVVIRTGDLGEPEVDLSPLRYNYEHRIPLEIATYESMGRTSEEALDDMLMAIGAGVEADRYLRGLCEWLEPAAPLTEDISTDTGAGGPRGADLYLIASYWTTNPLT